MVLVGFAPTGDLRRRAGGELTADEVGEAVLDAETLMGMGSTRAKGGLTDWLGEM